MKQSHKTLVLWVVLIGIFVAVYYLFRTTPDEAKKVKFSTLTKTVATNPKSIKSLKFEGNDVHGCCISGHKFKTHGLLSPELLDKLDKAGVSYDLAEKKESIWPSLLISWLPILLLVLLFFFFMRQLQAGGGKAMTFGKSKAKLLSEGHDTVTFKDVAGIEEAKEEVEEIIDFLKDPKRFTRLGGRIPKGVLLMGPPGTGKTLLARAIAGEAGVPFFGISGSDFVEMFVGVGASRVRDLFEQGKKNAPCIIFIDEIDAVGRHRGAGLGGGHDEREQTLNQLLVEMDGFESNDGVILIAATNRPDVLDPALLRPGRFDRRIMVPRPDVVGRLGILEVHTKKMPLAEDVALNVIARGTPGFSGADLENLVNEAALLAARSNGNVVAHEDFETAKDKVMMGRERKSLLISEEQKKVTAYHEAGHTLVAKLAPGEKDPIHKVTIIPRGWALGLTQQIPEEDRYNSSDERTKNEIAILMGGRIAEELVFEGRKTNGSKNDIERATELARKMVCEWGMSDVLGPLSFGKKEEQIFLGREIAQHQDYSEETARVIDGEVKRIVLENYDRAKEILSDHIDILHALANALLKREVLSGQEVDVIVSRGRLGNPPTSGTGKIGWGREEHKANPLDGVFSGTGPFSKPPEPEPDNA
ncbi:MAG: ATP-dependent zinc metalloprotease FtsH [Deltaproteobacteria bacterium]|nr:ATP-dependent zinc metalloprotease FtsH [Deltaproteobacteria bacterium]